MADSRSGPRREMPRAWCQFCKREVPVLKNGLMREHHPLEFHPSRGFYVARRACQGSGAEPLEPVGLDVSQEAMDAVDRAVAEAESPGTTKAPGHP